MSMSMSIRCHCKKCARCVQNVRKMCVRCMQELCKMFSICVQDVRKMCARCVQDMRYTMCARIVQDMLNRFFFHWGNSFFYLLILPFSTNSTSLSGLSSTPSSNSWSSSSSQELLPTSPPRWPHPHFLIQLLHNNIPTHLNLHH